LPWNVRVPVLSLRWLLVRCCCAVSFTAGMRLVAVIAGIVP
jgi:hypothetical protein